MTITRALYMADYLKTWAKDEMELEEYAVYTTNGSMSLGKAIKSDYKEEAKVSSKKELKQLVDIKSWKYLRSRADANQSVHVKEAPCSMFCKPKHDSKGSFLLWKSRLVGGGHRTDPNVYDNFEKHSPTVPIEVAMLQLGIASKERANIEVFDIPCAYLNASLKPDRQQLMRFPKQIADLLVEVDSEAKKFQQPDGTILVQVLRALYGFPESARLWYEYLSSALKNCGYTVSPSEPCLFKRFVVRNGRILWSTISIYVDDCLHTYNDEQIEILSQNKF
jgi:hypothetical protein